MAEENDTDFKITDRRKFNADGSPRDQVDELPEVQAGKPANPVAEEPAQSEQSTSEQAASEQPADEPANVVSFRERKREPPPTEQPAPAPRPMNAAEQAYSQTTVGQPRGLPEASFLSLINMLAVEAAMHLGLIETPGEASPGIDLEAARHMIDMLSVLEQKTRGNLSADEDKLLENILADLRMQYVALSRRR